MKSYIDGSRIASKATMLRNFTKSKCFLIVEGETDSRLYKKFVDSDKCQIIIAENKDNVIESIKILNSKKFEGVLGIVDSDFWKLDRHKNTIENVYTTDYHDLEVMLINTKALEDIISEYADSIKYEEFTKSINCNIRTHLYKNGGLIGFLRWFSSKRKIGLNFNNIDYEKFLDINTLNIDLKSLISTVIANSNIKGEVDNSLILETITNMQDKGYDLLHICCGHDLTEILSIGLSKTFGSYNAKNMFSGKLEGSLRLTYNLMYFQYTELHSTLLEWQKKNLNYRIFPYIEFDTAI